MPWTIRTNTSRREVAAQDAMTMSAADKKAFFQTNAEKVFGL